MYALMDNFVGLTLTEADVQTITYNENFLYNNNAKFAVCVSQQWENNELIAQEAKGKKGNVRHFNYFKMIYNLIT